MKTFVGIDLGSTSTKAVLLDEEGGAIGHGVTNTCANYAAAARSARDEAHIGARFTLLRRALVDAAGVNGHLEGFLGLLETSFRLEQFIGQLGALERSCRRQAKSERFAGVGGALQEALFEIFARLRREAPAFYAARADRASDSFADIARSRYCSQAEEVANDVKLPCDLLLDVYDKSIVAAEDCPPVGAVGETLRRALARTVAADPSVNAAVRGLQATIDRALGVELEDSYLVGTGYGRVTLPFSKDHIRSEILCHGLGAHMMFPNTRTVLDIGGQDTKGIRVDRDGIVENFQMNDRCAAGCGRYLGYIANEMNIGLHELGPLAMRSEHPAPINSTCTVFAGAELRDRLSLGERREDILAGLHRAIILRALSIIARLGGVIDEFTFTGGVAKNAAAVGELRRLVEENYGETTINVSPDSIYAGARGAAEFARRAFAGGARMDTAA